jgi:hypothetical protein
MDMGFVFVLLPVVCYRSEDSDWNDLDQVSMT